MSSSVEISAPAHPDDGPSRLTCEGIAGAILAHETATADLGSVANEDHLME